jgi:hypothetical protein
MGKTVGTTAGPLGAGVVVGVVVVVVVGVGLIAGFVVKPGMNPTYKAVCKFSDPVVVSPCAF